MPDYAIEVEGLRKRYGAFEAVRGVDLRIVRGEIFALLGPNGAGKTTVFNCLTGYYKPTVGRLTLRAPQREFLLERMEGFRIGMHARVARTFQNIRLFPKMTVLENLIVAQHNKLMRASGYTVLGLFGAGGYRHSERKAIELARYWLEQIDLVPRADVAAESLAYGDQRRLEIARAMCTEPVLLCLDEPAAGLNPSESAALNRLLNFIKNEHKIGILLIEHDMSVVMEISDHIIVLDYGKKISDGDPHYVRNDPNVIRAYLGEEEDEDLPPEIARDLAKGGDAGEQGREDT